MTETPGRAAVASAREGVRAADGTPIAHAATPGRRPGVLFCGGFRSDMTGTKASWLEAACRGRGLACVRFDYRGHGATAGRFEDGTIGGWADDALRVLDGVTTGPVVLVGSSMGAWIAALLVRRRPERVAGLVTVAAAPDFTEDLIWDAEPEAVRQTLWRDGVWYRPSDYGPDPDPITLTLIEEARECLVLRRPLAFDGPVRLIHGMADRDVPWQRSLALAEALTGADARLILVKDGDHRLSRPQDLDLLTGTVMSVCDAVADRTP